MYKKAWLSRENMAIVKFCFLNKTLLKLPHFGKYVCVYVITHIIFFCFHSYLGTTKYLQMIPIVRISSNHIYIRCNLKDKMYRKKRIMKKSLHYILNNILYMKFHLAIY
jgi:hypothetical protein